MHRPTRATAIVVALTVLSTLGIRVHAQKLMPAFNGEAKIEITKPAMKVSGDEVITTVLVKNMEAAPIAGLRIEEFWYDAKGAAMATTTYLHPKPLQPGEVITVTLKTNKVKSLSRNKVNFTHAHGTIKPTVVPKLDAPKT